jgi:hypothetical protein
LLTYAKEDYEFRTSGVILDAVAARAAIVCPDFPIFEAQISKPATVGYGFGESRTLDEAVARAAELAEDPAAPFEAYLAARSASGLGSALRAMISGAAGTVEAKERSAVGRRSAGRARGESFDVQNRGEEQ